MAEIEFSKEKLDNIKVSIGLAIYNEEKNIRNTLEAILNQSHKNFELIVSDDCSKDNTLKICKEFQSNDKRIQLYEQKKNVGVAKNFHFVFEKSTSNYFVWLAGDDIISLDYIEENLKTLQQNKNCVFAASPHCFKGDESNESKYFTFSIKGSLYEKGQSFLNNCFNATGCNFAIFKKEVLSTVPEMEKKFLGHDWKVLCHSLSQGEFVRSKKGLLILGREGLSASPDFMGKEAKKISEHILPIIEFSKFFFRVYIKSTKIKNKEKIILFYSLIKINLWFVLLKYLNIMKKIIKKSNHPKLGDAYK